MSFQRRPNVRVEILPDQPMVEADADAREHATSSFDIGLQLSGFGRWALAALILSMVAFACGAGALGRDAKFLYRDDVHVSQNPALRAWAGLKPIWFQPHHLPSFSPIGYSAYLIEYRLFGGEKAEGYHVVSLLLHAANAMLLWTLLKKLELPGAWLAAALFAAHPVQVDAVAWAAQQRIVLCTTFYLAALLVHFRYCGLNPQPPEDQEHAHDFNPFQLPRTRWLVYAIAIALFGVAALTQPMLAVTWPLVVLIAIWWERARVTRADVVALVPFIAIALLGASAGIFVEVFRFGARGEDFPSLAQRAQLLGMTTWTCLANALLPWPGRLSFAYPRWTLPTANVLNYVPTVLLIGAIVLSLAFWRKLGRGFVAAALLYVAILLPFSGVANFDWMRQSYVADHMQYLALAVPMTAIATWAWSRLETNRLRLPGALLPYARPAVVVLLVGVLVGVSFARSTDYRDQRVLWTRVVEQNPRSVVAENSLGRFALDEDKNPSEAIRHFLLALENDPANPTTHMNLAQAYEALGETDRAIGAYHKVLLARPDDVEARFGLAHAYATMGDSRRAIEEYHEVIRRAPDHANAYNNLALLHVSRGETDQAEETYRKAIERNPRMIAARINLANLLFGRRQVQAAAEELAAVLKIDPQNGEAYFAAGAMTGTAALQTDDRHERAKLLSQSEVCFRRAARLRPQFAPAWNQLGTVLLAEADGMQRDQAGAQVNEAAACFRRALELDANDASAAANLRLAEREREAVANLPARAVYAPTSRGNSGQ